MKFVTGFLFISSVAIQLVGELLDVSACDGAHVDWDSFTLYSINGLSSDRHTFNIGHALLFGKYEGANAARCKEYSCQKNLFAIRLCSHVRCHEEIYV